MPGVHLTHREFGKWRNYLWPVHNYELKKLIPMLLIFFLIYFDYNVLRIMKDTLVVTAKSSGKASGASVIPYIKVWAMFPGAIFMTFIFTRLSNRFSRENVFYIMTAAFLIYFFIFTFILYPIRDTLHPHALADTLQTFLPEGCKGLIAVFRNWTFTTFYVMSELWGSIVSTLLFWGFANQVTRLNEAKRFYGLFGIGANLSGVFAGQASVYLCRTVYDPRLPFGSDAWEQSMIMLIGLVLFAGILAIVIFRWVQVNILSDPLYCDQQGHENGGQAKSKLSLRESVKYLMRSKYLLCLAVLVISYNIVLNLVEVVWKDQVSELYPHSSDYHFYMNQVSTIIGIIATLCALFVSGNSIRKQGWTFTAMLTPFVILLSSICFFFFFFLKEHPSTLTKIIGGAATPLAIVVFFGSAQNIVCRAAKYSVFDATKEMAFIPLSTESQIKGKAVIDGVGSRLGKSGGSIIHQSLLIFFVSIAASAGYVAGILLVVILCWMIAVCLLGKRFNEITASLPLGTPEQPTSSPSLVLQTELKEQKVT